MARIIGGIGTSHIPAIGLAMARNECAQPYWKPFFDAYLPVREWLAAAKPTVAVVIYNDHGLNFFLDKMPTFAIGAAHEYCNADEGWACRLSLRFRAMPRFPGISSNPWPPRTSISQPVRKCWSITGSWCRCSYCGRAPKRGRCARFRST